MTTESLGKQAKSRNEPSPPPLAVVVPTRDRPELLDGCLAALRAALRPGDELIVVDSASTDALVIEVALRHRARLVRCGWPGTSRARNAGAAVAAHEIVAFVDDDVRVDHGWADAMSSAFAEGSGVAFVTGRLGVAPGQRGRPHPVAVVGRDDPAVIAPGRPVLGHGANLAVRKGVLEAVGGFDHRLGPGSALRAAEDHDLLDRLLAGGFEGRYAPAASGTHEQWRSRWQLLALEWSYGVGTGARLVRLLGQDRRRAGEVVRESLWHNGLRTVPGSIRHRYELGIALVAVRTVATGWGMAEARRRRLLPRGPTATPPPGPARQDGGHGRR